MLLQTANMNYKLLQIAVNVEWMAKTTSFKINQLQFSTQNKQKSKGMYQSRRGPCDES